MRGEPFPDITMLNQISAPSANSPRVANAAGLIALKTPVPIPFAFMLLPATATFP